MPEPSLAVVTGASSGLGEAFAEALAARGHRVLAVARRTDRLAALETRCSERVVPFGCDLTAPDAIDRVLDRAGEEGPVELLVANAGRGAHGPAWTIPAEVTTEVVRLNVLAGTELTTRLLPGMVDRGRGGVIVVTSSGGFYPTPYLATYGATKAFLLSFTEAIAVELGGTGVRAMALCPGPTSTGFGETAGMSELLANAPGLMTPAAVVAEALRSWDRGRTVCLPGATTRATTPLLARLPRAVTRRMMGRVFSG